MSIDVSYQHGFNAFDLDIGFAVDQPGITALFGPSGSGKSTTINVIAGLLKPRSGTVRLNGEAVLDTATRTNVAARKRQIGYVFQDSRLFPHLNVQRNLDFGAKRARDPLGRAARGQVIEMLGLGELTARMPRQLSGGERQRVALGRALLKNPSVLLLDEPMASLDSARKAGIMPYLERLRDEARIPILFVSHSIDEVTRLSNDIVVIDKGRVAASGPVDEIMARLDLFPLTGRFEAGAVLEGTVAAHLDDAEMSQIDVGGNSFLVPRVREEIGAPLRLRVRARDVMLASEKPGAISANNVLACTIAALREDKGPYVDVRLDCAGTALLARITKLSRDRLSIREGAPVWAVIKSLSVERTPARGAKAS
ncbi:molybdenum ABC transporter ATP-binding protein [Tepidamorphus sp. 3E244]|uniref:molybdenum ABC transporter ATP-binding protein n=1 Tax=Tepidamorphus sp. 3E244 TaxID=3385498 RepID=UPI0038FD3047